MQSRLSMFQTDAPLLRAAHQQGDVVGELSTPQAQSRSNETHR